MPRDITVTMMLTDTAVISVVMIRVMQHMVCQTIAEVHTMKELLKLPRIACQIPLLHRQLLLKTLFLWLLQQSNQPRMYRLMPPLQMLLLQRLLRQWFRQVRVCVTSLLRRGIPTMGNNPWTKTDRIVMVIGEEIIQDTPIEGMNQRATMTAVVTGILLQGIMIEDQQKGVVMTHGMAMIVEVMAVMILIQGWMIDMTEVVTVTEEILILVILALALVPGPDLVPGPVLVRHPHV